MCCCSWQRTPAAAPGRNGRGELLLLVPLCHPPLRHYASLSRCCVIARGTILVFTSPSDELCYPGGLNRGTTKILQGAFGYIKKHYSCPLVTIHTIYVSHKTHFPTLIYNVFFLIHGVFFSPNPNTPLIVDDLCIVPLLDKCVWANS